MRSAVKLASAKLRTSTGVQAEKEKRPVDGLAICGFHINGSKCGDDDLDSGVIESYRLFLVWNDLVVAEGTLGLELANMNDHSYNETGPIESLMISALKTQRPYVTRWPAATQDHPVLRSTVKDSFDILSLTPCIESMGASESFKPVSVTILCATVCSRGSCAYLAAS